MSYILSLWTGRLCGKHFPLYAKGAKRRNSLPMQNCDIRPINKKLVGVINHVIHDTFDVPIGGIKRPQTMLSLKYKIKKFEF